MNWEAVGAIGEVSGAGAVVVTLFYLARQIRQNSDSLDRSKSCPASRETPLRQLGGLGTFAAKSRRGGSEDP